MLHPGGNWNCLHLSSPWHTGASRSEGTRREDRKAAAPSHTHGLSLIPIPLLRICVSEINPAALASPHILSYELTKVLKVCCPGLCQLQSAPWWVPSKRGWHPGGMKTKEVLHVLGCACRLSCVTILYTTLKLRITEEAWALPRGKGKWKKASQKESLVFHGIRGPQQRVKVHPQHSHIPSTIPHTYSAPVFWEPISPKRSFF